MSLLTPDEVRGHLESDLEDPALQRLIDAAEEEIVSRFGANPDEEGTIALELVPRGDLLFLNRPLARQEDVDQLIETRGTVETDVDMAGFRILHGGYTLQRIGTTWAWNVRMVYTPASDLARRKRVLIDLVHLANDYKPVTAGSSGDVTESPVEYQKERERILSELGGGPQVG